MRSSFDQQKALIEISADNDSSSLSNNCEEHHNQTYTQIHTFNILVALTVRYLLLTLVNALTNMN